MLEPAAITCPHCGASVPRYFQYCGLCGRILNAGSDEDRGAPIESASAERRQITVVFCDLVGSVQLSRLLDPEDFAYVVRRYQALCVEAIEAHDGYVAQYLGDGILAYFGYPTANERVAEQAVRAGLSVLVRMKALNADIQREHGPALGLRIGIHTGLVVVEEVGSGEHRERLALGETPNLAARIQAAAATDTLVVSRETYRLVEGAFQCVDLGKHVLKGHETPQHLYRVVEERHEVDLSRNALSTVGREDDLNRLLETWAAASSGCGRAALVTGDAGVGKTHLVQHLRSLIPTALHHAVVCRCAPNCDSTPFHPVVDWLFRVLNFFPEQPMADRLEMIRFVADRNGLTAEDVAPLLGALLTRAALDDISELGYSPARARQRTYDIVVDLILSMAAERPVLFIVEDVHWIDPSTRDFLQHFSERISAAPVLLLATARGEAAFELSEACPCIRIELGHLSADQIAQVIDHTAGERILPKSVVDAIKAKSGGVPLYAQEFTKMIVESGHSTDRDDSLQLRSALPDLSIPSTLQDSLMARLDRIMPVKEVAQVCSALGRSFTIDLIQAARPGRRNTIRSAIDQLIRADILVVERGPGPARYQFKHALLQEAAYESMLKSTRALVHDRVASFLMDRGSLDNSSSEVIAYHLAKAGRNEAAAEYWYRAGKEAQDRWANEEAIEYFSRGLDLLGGAFVSDAQRLTAFHLYVGLASTLLQKKGYTHPEVAAAFERAADLAPDLHDAAASIPALIGLWSHYTVLGHHTRAEVLAERLSKLAQLAPPSISTFSARSARAHTWFWQGDLGASRMLIESLLERLSEVPYSSAPGMAFQHPRIGCLSYLSLIHWSQGRPEDAKEVGCAAVRAAEKIGHPFSLAFASGFNSVLHIYMDKIDAVRELSDQTVDVAERYGFPFWATVGKIIRSWADADHDPDRAVAGMQKSLGDLQAAGVRIWTTYPSSLMAALLHRLGRCDEALDLLDTVVAQSERHGEFYFMPEVRRLRARVLASIGLEEQASEELKSALAMAQRQTAYALALRIVIDMARHTSMPTNQLQDLLRTAVDAIPPGSETSDLLRARSLLTASMPLRPPTIGQA